MPTNPYHRQAADIKTWFIGNKKTAEDERGEKSEIAFESMTRFLIDIHKLWWALGIAKSTASEDILKKIDFKIRVFANNRDGSLSEFIIPIQVKSSSLGAWRFVKENGKDIPVVVMYPDMQPAILRKILFNIYFHEVRRRR
jgi:hypothetical protein